MPEFADNYASPEDAGDIPSPPGGDVGEALAQLNERFDAFEQGGDEGFEEEPGYVDDEGYGEPEPDTGALESFVDERMTNILDFHNEIRDRSAGLERLAETYPELNTPEVANQVRNVLEAQGLLPGDGVPPTALNVEIIYKALAADRAAAAEVHPEDLPASAGATLETGGGPGAATESESDPVTAAYLGALRGGRPRDAFS